ncbi:MAG: hypothetical protein J7K75_06285 [Desulfuromonas sp.]|nr:hypothetical protein [Desulfuromonas sp.]
MRENRMSGLTRGSKSALWLVCSLLYWHRYTEPCWCDTIVHLFIQLIMIQQRRHIYAIFGE